MRLPRIRTKGPAENLVLSLSETIVNIGSIFAVADLAGQNAERLVGRVEAKLRKAARQVHLPDEYIELLCEVYDDLTRDVRPHQGRPRAAVCATDGRGYAGARTPASSPTAGAGARRIEPCAGRGAGSHSGVRRPLSYNPGGLASAAVGQGPPIISGDRQLQKGWELGDGREAPRHGASCLGHNGQSRAPSGVAAPPQRRRGSLHRNWRTLLWPGRRGCRSISPQGASGGVSLSGSQPRRAPLQTAFNGGRKPLLMPFKWPGATLHIQAARPAVYSAKCAA